MQGILLVIGIVIMISSFYKGEKKKKEALAKKLPPFGVTGRTGVNRGNRYQAISKRSNEERILEKARMMNKENEVYSPDPVQEFLEWKEPLKTFVQEEKVDERVEVRQSLVEEPFSRGVESGKTLIKEEKSRRFDETFDGFCASDALYLARKDAEMRKSFM